MKKLEKIPKIQYGKLNARQKETYNFQKVSAILADYGFCTIKLSDDWQGADFLAHCTIEDNESKKNIDIFLKVQLKGRLTISRKYIEKDIYICFPNNSNEEWYLYPHDEIMYELLKKSNIENTKSWTQEGGETYSFNSITNSILEILSPYKLGNEYIKL